MKKLHKSLLACALSATVFVIGGMSSAFADTTDRLSPILVYGQAAKVEGDKLHITNSNPEVIHPNMIVSTSKETTRILDAVTGFPVAFENIKEGETVYAYIGPAMTLSLPPMASASLILCNIPADYKVPEFLKVASLEPNKDKSIATLKATNGQSYTIPADAEVIPYLTRNYVTVTDLTPGRNCLLWSNAGSNVATKVVIFPEDTEDEQSPSLGWKQKDGLWYYYNEDGTLHSGWLNDNGDWYYLNTETNVMHTGFLTLDGKTYYLKEDGKMLTNARSFTPDSDGVLR